jgi:CheY-like chemotaxis protein
MDNELTPSAQPESTPPQGQPGGGKFSRRRRRKRGKKPMPGAQAQHGQAGPAHAPHRPPAGGGPHHPPGGKRKNRSQRARQPRTFVGPMDHSYRSGQEVNGNVADHRRTTNGYDGQYRQPDMTPVSKAAEPGPARIFCFIEDLFFLAKINEVAKKLNLRVEFVKTAEQVLDRAGDDVPENERPQLVAIDLNNPNIKPLVLIPKLRAKLKKTASIIGFLPHVQGDLKVKAQEAGCDMVMPRSAFSQNLPNLLRRHGSDEEEEDTRQPL